MGRWRRKAPEGLVSKAERRELDQASEITEAGAAARPIVATIRRFGTTKVAIGATNGSVAGAYIEPEIPL
jgi:hypothetical protein